MIRFSANLGFLWNGLPLLDRIEKAAQAGFQAIELHWPFEIDPLRLRDACRQHNVLLLVINSEPGNTSAGDFGLAALPGREAEFFASTTRAITYAKAAQAKAIHILVGIVPTNRQLEAREVLVNNLRRAATDAAGCDLSLFLEPMNPIDRPGYFYSRSEEAVDVIRAIDAGNVFLMFDSYHAATSGADLVQEFEQFYSWIGHIQIASIPNRKEPARGEPQLFEFLYAVQRSDYSGWIGCEYRPATTPEEGLRWLKPFCSPRGDMSSSIRSSGRTHED